MKSPEKTVMLFGTFDYLHAGHENIFKQARTHGEKIIVIIARDRTVKTIKGTAPDHNEKTRLKNLQATGWADQVVLGNLKDKTRVITHHKPDIIALGYDQFAFTYNLQKLIIDQDLNASIIRLEPYKPEIYKSSIIKNKLLKNKKNT